MYMNTNLPNLSIPRVIHSDSAKIAILSSFAEEAAWWRQQNAPQ
jgi:hypothetical protein